MKKLHKDNLFCWSEFNEERNIDFHSYLWVRESGNVVIDPLPISQHDLMHLRALGPLKYILITNSDHIRDAGALKELTGAEILGPSQEKNSFPLPCSQWISESFDGIEELEVIELSGSKTKGELAFLIEGKTLVTGDLIRAHEGGRLCLLPDGKLKDKAAAKKSVEKLLFLKGVEAVLPGDGWPIFTEGERALQDLLARL